MRYFSSVKYNNKQKVLSDGGAREWLLPAQLCQRGIPLYQLPQVWQAMSNGPCAKGQHTPD